MNREALRREARRLLDDTSGKRLWTDDELNQFIDDAVREATGRSPLIRSTSQHTITYAERFIALENLRRVEHVEARIGDMPVPRVLDIVSERDANRNVRFWKTAAGIPCRAVVAADRSGIWVTPVPVQTTPAVTVSVTSTDICPGLPADRDSPPFDERHHRWLIEWVCYRAYQKRDPDSEDRDRRNEHYTMFERAFGPQLTADQQLGRAAYGRHTTTPAW